MNIYLIVIYLIAQGRESVPGGVESRCALAPCWLEQTLKLLSPFPALVDVFIPGVRIRAFQRVNGTFSVARFAHC